jgi:hypothetical protein
MTRQFRADLRGPEPVGLLYALSYSLMQTLSTGNGQALIDCFPVQRVAKAKARRNRAVRPFIVAAMLQERHPLRERRAPFLDLGDGQIVARCNGRGGERDSTDAGDLENSLIVRNELSKLLGDRLEKILRCNSIDVSEAITDPGEGV